ncbi:MAG TPA: phosphatase PAP2 family protein [Candidatus Saccharimonadales bacterium]|nr:phosphatase PAP2 family protein [Candidatus Saccharimonadales bacterium]
MKLSLARFVSLLFNPFVILVFLPFFLVYKSTGNPSESLGWTAYSFMFLLIVASIVVYYVRKKVFSDLDVSVRKQRPLLFKILLIAGLIYILGLYSFNAPGVLYVMVYSLLFGILVASVINVRIKASLHVATVSALILGFVLGYGGRYVWLLLLIPLVGWSRVKLKRHTVSETVVGGVVGSLLLLFIYAFFEVFLKG